MPRYFFHHRDGDEHLDHQGVELADVSAARIMAVSSAGEAIKDLGGRFWAHPEWQTWVTDERGATVCSFTFVVNAGAE